MKDFNQADQQQSNERIAYYKKMIALDKALHKSLSKALGLLIFVPFSQVRRMRIIIEMEAINNRIISRQNFLDMYVSRVNGNHLTVEK